MITATALWIRVGHFRLCGCQ